MSNVHMRTVREVAATGILPESTIRLMLKQNLIDGVVFVGKKALINFDRFVDQLNEGDVIHVVTKE